MPTTPTLTELATKLVASLENSNGQFRSVTFKSNPPPAAAHKGVVLEKVTTMVVRTGVNFSNLSSVKSAIASGERDEVGKLPWGNWLKFPFIIGHKDEEFVRLTTVKDAKPSTIFKVNDVVTSREEFNSFLTPSAAKPSESVPEVLTVKVKNILTI